MTDIDHPTQERPNPGSSDAVTLGCRCPTKHNHDGATAPFAAGTLLGGSDGGWLVSVKCELHGDYDRVGAFFGS